MLVRIKSLAGQSLVYGLGGLLSKALSFLLIPLYTQFLTPADYGILNVTITLNAVLGIILEAGVGSALTRFYYDFKDDQKALRNCIGTAWLFLMALPLGLTLLLNWQGAWLFNLIFKQTPFDPYIRLVIWITFLTMADVIPLALFRVREQPALYAGFALTRFVMTTLAIIYFVTVRQEGALGSLKGQLIAGLLITIPLTIITLRNSKLTMDWSRLKGLLAFGLPMVPHQLSAWALNLSDRLILERFVTMEQLGIYSLGYRLAQIMDMILNYFNMAWAPFFYRTAASEKDGPQILARLTTYYTVFLVTLGLGLSLLVRDVVYIMARPGYYEAVSVTPVVVLAYVAHGGYFMLVNQLFFAKKTQRLPLYTMTSAIVNIVLNLLTVPYFGIIAAAWNTVIGYVILAVLVFLESRQIYPLPYEYGRLGRILLATVLTYVLCSLIRLPNPWVDFIARSFGLLLFPATLIFTGFFTHQEVALVRSLPARLGKRFAGHQDS